MKRLFLFTACLMLAINAFAQNDAPKIKLPLKDNAIIYEEVVKLADSTINANELFNLAQTWFINNLKSPKSVLEINDREGAKLTGKGVAFYRSGYGSMPDVYLYYSVDVFVKTGKYRYRFYNFGYQNNLTDHNLDIRYNEYLNNNVSKVTFESKKAALLRYEKEFLFASKMENDLSISLKNSMTSSGTNLASF
jgi:hypothetical protein